MPDSFVHLHVHTEFSMLDGAAKNGKLIAEVERQGMPAVAMSDHGNMFGAYEFAQLAGKTVGEADHRHRGLRRARFALHKKQVFWAPGGQKSANTDGEGGKDVSGGGRYTHMTMWAQNAQGLRNLFRLSSLASIEGYYMKPRMDRELIAEHADGHHRDHRLPVRRGADAAAARAVRRGGQGGERLPGHLRPGQLLPGADGPRPRHRARRPL